MELGNIITTRINKKIYRNNNQLIKLFAKEYSKVDVLNEALNQARVENVGLNIPKIIAVNQTKNNEWLIASDFIEGKTLEQLMVENPNKIDEYLNYFVDLQILVHKKRCPMLNRLKEKMLKKIEATTLDYTTKYELKTRLEGMPSHYKLCHGDFVPSNIIINDQNEPYIIDWAHATQGNASADVAKTYLSFCLHKNVDLANKYLELFCLKSKTDIKYVQKWMPIVAACQLSKNNKEEKEFLLSWVDIADYQ